MKNYLKNLVIMKLFFVAFMVGAMVFVSNGWAKGKTASLEKQIQGSWGLVSLYIEKDGEKINPFGDPPRGSMILMPNGRFSVIFLNSTLPKFAANNRRKGTVEENQAVVQGSLAYFGSYKVMDSKEHMVSFNIEGSTYPNWDGEEQKLIMNVAGDEMRVVNPTPSVGGTGYPVWKRVNH
jgi:hypothetical protein